MSSRSGILSGVEQRASKGNVELRDGPNGPMITGYGAVFGSDSRDMGFIEQVDSRAFDKTLREADVRGLVNHDPNWLIGRSRSGTLRLSTDQRGLRYEIDINPEDPDGQRAIAKVRRGDLDGSSFSFTTIRDSWDWAATPPKRMLLEVSLMDVGPVTFPAYPDATAAARALQPVADKVGRPVSDLVSALAKGEIRSLIEGKAVAVDVETRAAGDVAWGPEDGFCDLISDVNDQLGMFAGVMGQAFYCVDAAVTLDKVLLSDWDSDEFWVAPIAIGPDSEPVLSAQTDWVSVEQGWVVSAEDDDEDVDGMMVRMLQAALVEERAGKKFSAQTMESLRGIMKQLRDLLKSAKTEGPADSDVADAADVGDPGRSLVALQVELRDRELKAMEDAA